LKEEVGSENNELTKPSIHSTIEEFVGRP